MKKILLSFENWLYEHVPFWGWEPGYTATSHIIWGIVTLITLLTFGLLHYFGICTLGVAITVFNSILGGGQILAILQELLRHLIVKRKDKNDKFSLVNVFSCIMGLAIGVVFLFIIWYLII